MNKSIIQLFLVCLLISIISCQEESIIKNDLVTLNSLENRIAIEARNNRYNAGVRKIAKSLAKSLKNKNLREVIKTKAALQLDGDYEITWKTFKNQAIEVEDEKKSFIDLIAENYSESDKSKMSKINELEEFSRTFRKLQIAVPVNCEGWDTETFIPVVAFLTAEYSEDQEEIQAFNANGKLINLSNKTTPEVPVIVVNLNERSDEDGNILDDYTFLRVEEGDDPPLDDPPPSGSPGCDRDSNPNRDFLNKARFNSIAAYRSVEAWPTGRPEFKVILTYTEKQGTSYATKTLTKILSKDGWVTRYVFWSNLRTKEIDISMLTWDKSRYGDTMKYTWIEMDGGSPIELSTSVATKFEDGTVITNTVKTTISSEDKEAGEGLVEYCDNTDFEGTSYDTGILTFWINQQ